MSKADPEIANNLTNKSVIKAMGLLGALGRFPDGVTATELAQSVRFSRPTVFRLLQSLVQTGFVEKFDSRYSLGWKIAQLGRLADPHGGLVARIKPVLDALADELNEMVGYAVVHGEGEFDLVAEASSSRLLTLSQGYVGREFPLHASATGKIVLAEMSDDAVRGILPKRLPRLTAQTITSRDELLRTLAQVRSRQYAIIDDELEESLFSLAIPVRNASAQLIGVISATGPSPRMKHRDFDHLVTALRAKAMNIVSLLAPE